MNAQNKEIVEIKQERRGSKTQKDFSKVVKGYNWCTPTLKFYTRIGIYVIEVSSGKGWVNDGSIVYGATIVNTETQEMDSELSDMFFSMKELTDYLSTL